MDLTTTATSIATTLGTQPKTQTPTKTENEQRAVEAGKKFESMFLGQMLNLMQTDLDTEGGYFGGGHAEAMFRPMLMEEYAKSIVKKGGIGIAEQVTRTLLQHQEGKR